MIIKFILSIVILIAIIYIVIHNYGEFSNRQIFNYIIIGVVIISIGIALLNSQYIVTIKYSIFISLLYVATITDLKSKEIVQVNIDLIYISIFLFFTIDCLDKIQFEKILVGLAIMLLCKILNKLNWMGEGDNAIILLIVYIFGFQSILVLGIGSIINAIIAIVKYKSQALKTGVALVPGMFIAIMIIGYLILYYHYYIYV